MRYLALSILIVLLIVTSVNGQGTYRFRHIGVEDGLSQGSIYHMLKDSRGFLWLGSQDGINRFDGKKIEVFLSGASGESTNVQGIAEDSQGNVWIGSHKGVYKYIRAQNRFTKPFIAASLVKGSIHVAKDKNGHVLLLAENGLFTLKDNKAKLLTRKLVYNRSQFNNFFTETPDGDLWLIGHERGIKRYSRLTQNVTDYFTEVSSNAEELISPFTSITTDKKGNVWIGGDKLIRLDYMTDSVKVFNTATGASNHSILDITEDMNGKLWLGTEQAGILIFDPDNAKILQHIHHEDDEPNSLKFNEVSEIFIDENNDVFANTDPQGLDIITGVASAFSYYTYGKNPDSNLSAYSVRGLAEDQNADIWIGTELGGLNRLNAHSGEITHYSIADGLPQNIIRYVFKDPDNRIWVATLNGFALYDTTSNRFKSFELPVFCEVTNVLSIDKDLLLLVSNKGLMLFDTTKMEVVEYSHSGFVGGYTSYMDKTSGLIYIANRYRGTEVFKIVDGKLKAISKLLSGYHVLHLYADPREPFFWACTNRGLVKWNIKENKIAKSWHVKDGLHHEYIYSLQPDLAGNLWLSTNRGLTRFNPKTERFDFIKEIPPREYNSRSSLATTNGELYFGSTRGLDRIKPKLLNLRSDHVKVHLTGLSFDQTFPDTATRYIGEQHAISLPFSENSFTLKFTSTDYRSGGLNRYRYLLKGYDKDTIYAGTMDQVRYAMLPAGNYEFQVQASDLGGQWVSTVQKLSIVILPPFWQTWWFVLLVSLAILAIAFLVIRAYLNYRLREQTLESEKRISVEKERSRIARDMNDSLGSELFGLKLLGQVAMSQESREDANSYLQRIVDTSKSISEQISEVIWLTDSDQDNVESLWTYIQKNAFIYLKPAGIHYEFDPLPKGYTSIISGEKRHDILNFYKMFYIELTKFFTSSAVRINFSINKSLLTITLENAELCELDKMIAENLKKVNGKLVKANSGMSYIGIPLEY
ncbi:two-component regulator propeller domain-containing protein [Dyadobacter sp. CY312]|uniref:ligand-binding sensor domain-containing protein n=1 Tax=Dyadobacter sp. CY312 TaxID=2907303 RepID=UPI001F485F9F|nr:sensor histidine kinase [Dyadobacter sp. CY312]MCE7039467.1 histidine kinase [Dyadobacter sp. CY312]